MLFVELHQLFQVGYIAEFITPEKFLLLFKICVSDKIFKL